MDNKQKLSNYSNQIHTQRTGEIFKRYAALQTKQDLKDGNMYKNVIYVVTSALCVFKNYVIQKTVYRGSCGINKIMT